MAKKTKKRKFPPIPTSKAAQRKIKTVMEEFKEGELNIGKSKKKVKSRRQAIAIALAQARGIKKPSTSKRQQIKKKKK